MRSISTTAPTLSRPRTSNSPPFRRRPSASNVIPASATAQLNIRFNNLQRGADLVQLVEEIAEREAPGSTVRARISGEAFLTPPGELYDVVVSAIREETGIEPELSTSGGTSDGRFLIQLCPVVDFGLPNATMHKVGEHAAVEDIHALSRIYRPDTGKGIRLGDAARAAVGVLRPVEKFFLEHRVGEDEALHRVAAHGAKDVGLRDSSRPPRRRSPRRRP